MSAPHRNQSQRAPIGELGEPAAVKYAKMQGIARALPYLCRARSRAVGTPCARRKVRLRVAPLRMTHKGKHLLAQAIPRRAGVYSRRNAQANAPSRRFLPADMVALCRGIALSLRFLSLGYRFTKTPPRGVFACSHSERSGSGVELFRRLRRKSAELARRNHGGC